MKGADSGALLVSSASGLPPALVGLGQPALVGLVDWLTSRIRNPNTRAAYIRDWNAWFSWCAERELLLEQVLPFHVGVYIEELGERLAVSSVRRHLAAIRAGMDHLVVQGVLSTNPAHAVRGPRLSRRTGVTPILHRKQARQLFASFDTSHLIGLRDRALLSLLLYSFARVSAAVGMNVQDFRRSGGLGCGELLLKEKGGKESIFPVHEELAEALDEYLAEAKLSPEEPLFQTSRGRSRKLTGKRLSRFDAFKMIRRRLKDAALEGEIGCHSWRATGITLFLDAGGDLSTAQQLAGHADISTTRLYQRFPGADPREIHRVRL